MGRSSLRRGTYPFRRATTTTSWNSRLPGVFSIHSEAHETATCPKAVKSCQKGRFPKLSRDGGVYPRTRMPKRGTCSYPTYDHSRSPAIHSRTKKINLDRWQDIRELDQRSRFQFGVDRTENINVAVDEKVSRFFPNPLI